MVQGIVIPHDGGGGLRHEELAGLEDFQEATGGWIEPIELDGVDATLYVNGEALRHPGPFNSRATALHWYYGQNRDRALVVGDAVLVGSEPAATRAGLHRLVHGLLDHHEFVVQLSPDGLTWCDTPTRFASMFDAALWTVLVDGAMVDDVGLRIEALDTCDEHPAHGTRSW